MCTKTVLRTITINDESQNILSFRSNTELKTTSMNNDQLIQEIELQLDAPCPMIMAILKGKKKNKLYCKSCKKQLVDFREMAQPEILDYLQANKNSCGIFYEDQLKIRPFNWREKAFFKLLVAASFLGFAVQPIHAQNLETAPQELQVKAPLKKLKNEQKTTLKTVSETTEKKEKRSNVTKKKRRRRRFRLFRRKRVHTGGCPAF